MKLSLIYFVIHCEPPRESLLLHLPPRELRRVMEFDSLWLCVVWLGPLSFVAILCGSALQQKETPPLAGPLISAQVPMLTEFT